jgi:putative membrane protein
MKRVASYLGALAIIGAWCVAFGRFGITGHMIAHMTAVAVAAPLLAFGISGTAWDLTRRWPAALSPLPMSILEMLIVWGWHAPAAREFAASSIQGLLLEQFMFLAGGLLLWCACLGTLGSASTARRAAGVGALLLTTMHMTLLGVLIALAPRVLFGTAGFDCLGIAAPPLMDQQLGGVVMLLIGAGSYLVGGLLLMSKLLWPGQSGASPACR